MRQFLSIGQWTYGRAYQYTFPSHCWAKLLGKQISGFHVGIGHVNPGHYFTIDAEWASASTHTPQILFG